MRVYRLVLGILIAALGALVVVAVSAEAYRWPLALLTFVYVGGAGLHAIPIGHRAVPSFLGKRMMKLKEVGVAVPTPAPAQARRARTTPTQGERVVIHEAHFELPEGLNWLLPRPFMDSDVIDCREKALEVAAFSVLSRNRVPITVPKSVIRYRVANPAQSLSITEGVIEKSLVELAQQVLRDGIRRYTDAEVNDQLDELREELQWLADEQATDWGVDVITVLIGELVLPKSVQDEYEKIRQEELQREAETTELTHIAARIDALTADGLMTQDQAVELIQSERSKAPKATQQFRFDVSPQLRGLLTEILAKITGR
mgnify:CR=1 FL=1